MKTLIILPLTRRWALEMQAKQLAALDFSMVDAELLVFIDNTDIKEAVVANMMEKYEMTIPYHIRSSNRPAPHEVRINYRRDRIRDMLTMVQEEVRKMPQFEMMFMVEDDTKIAPDTLTKLMVDYQQLTEQNVKVGFIEGVQVGRHGIRMIGAWRTDDLENPTLMTTIPYNPSSLFSKIDGGGLYCFITPMELFLQHTFYWHDECFSVDVTYGLELRKKGYTNIIDWSVIAGHADHMGNVLIPNSNCSVAEYRKEGEQWKLQSKKGKVS
jgi:hypothetical protein